MLTPPCCRRQVRSTRSTPEQAACEMKIDEGLKTFWNVIENTCSTPPTDVNRLVRVEEPFSGISW